MAPTAEILFEEGWVVLRKIVLAGVCALASPE